MRLLFIACQQMEIGTKPILISVLTAVNDSALNAASVFPSRRIAISVPHTDLNRSADISIFLQHIPTQSGHIGRAAIATVKE
jgi:hypothetical protein